MAQRIQRHLPATGSIGVVEEITGVSKSTVRRLAATDPDFPKPFRLKERGHLQWSMAEVMAYLERKAGRALTV